ncbi:MAG: hypothetical protein KC766_42000 [Myxococcales bacterium]|nr:hypothetical protein [Myxococcales bacterium]
MAYAPAMVREWGSGVEWRSRGVIVGVATLLVAACGGSAVADFSDAGSAGAGGGEVDAQGGSAGFGGTTPTHDAGKDSSGGNAGVAGSEADSGYVDPGCPDAAPPEPDLQCDPYAANPGCAPGEACYPYVIYPGSVCEQETYGTYCVPAGVGEQGDPCGGGPCAAGFVCVVTGQGNQCVQLCQLQGDDGCPAGLFCLPVDVEGFGGCF